MIICDRCRQELKGAVTQIKILGKKYSLCFSCAESVGNYITYSAQQSTPIQKLTQMFKK